MRSVPINLPIFITYNEYDFALFYRNYQWPPATMAADEKAVDELRTHERQTSELEKQSILEFEGHLAAATTKKTITVETSLLISQLTTMDPT